MDGVCLWLKLALVVVLSGQCGVFCAAMQPTATTQSDSAPTLMEADACIPLKADILGKPFHSAAVRLPSYPDLKLDPAQVPLLSVEHVFLTQYVANVTALSTEPIQNIGMMLHGALCPDGLFLALTTRAGCGYVVCTDFGMAPADDVNHTSAIKGIDITDIIWGDNVNVSCDSGDAISGFANHKMCPVGNLERPCIAVHCSQLPAEFTGNSSIDGEEEYSETICLRDVLDFNSTLTHILLEAEFNVSRIFSDYLNRLISHQNEAASPSLEDDDNSTAAGGTGRTVPPGGNSDNGTSLESPISSPSPGIIEKLEAFGIRYPPLNTFSITFAADMISQTLIDVGDMDDGGVIYTVYLPKYAGDDDLETAPLVNLSRAEHTADTYANHKEQGETHAHEDSYQPFMEVDLSASAISAAGCHQFSGMKPVDCMRRIQMNLFQDPALFRTALPGSSGHSGPLGSEELNSLIVDVVLNDRVHVQLKDNSVAITIAFRPIRKAKPGESNRCVFWDFFKNKGAGGWNSSGCWLDNTHAGVGVACSCSHLTNFAILLTSDPVVSKEFEIVTYVGCGITLTAVSLALIVQIFAVRSLDHGDVHVRQRFHQYVVMMGLCVQLVCEYTFFIVSANFEPPALGCWVAVAGLHYFALSMFAWTVLEGYCLHKAVVGTFEAPPRRFVLKAILFAQGVPAAIVAAGVGITQLSYIDSNRCRLAPGLLFYASFLGPITVAILFNLTVFIHVQWTLRNISKRIARDQQQRVGRHSHRFRAAVGIFFLLGLGWLPGYIIVFLDRPPEATQWVFGIVTSFQGVVIFAAQLQNDAQLLQRQASNISLKSLMLSKTSRKTSTPSMKAAHDGQVSVQPPAIPKSVHKPPSTPPSDKDSLNSAPTPDIYTYDLDATPTRTKDVRDAKPPVPHTQVEGAAKSVAAPHPFFTKKTASLDSNSSITPMIKPAR